MPQAGTLHPDAPGAGWLSWPSIKRFMRNRTRRVRVDGVKLHAGDGQPVVVLPEFGAGSEGTARLRRLLRDAGYTVHDWGLGDDNGPHMGLDRLLRRLEERIIDLYEVNRHPVTLLGLGLSGIYAREVAKRVTPIVRQVITVGTPVRVVDPQGRCQMLQALFSPQAGVDALKLNRLRQRPPVPCTSIFTVTDEAVPCDLSEDVESITAENVIVPARRHGDLIRHPQTLEAITQRLARPQEQPALFE